MLIVWNSDTQVVSGSLANGFQAFRIYTVSYFLRTIYRYSRQVLSFSSLPRGAKVIFCSCIESQSTSHCMLASLHLLVLNGLDELDAVQSYRV